MDIQAQEKHLFHTQVKLILDFTNCSRLYNGKKTINSLLLPCFPMSVVNIEDDESELLKLLEHKVFSHCLRMDKEDHGGLSKTITNAHNVL